ncbi:MAG: MFS transporter [Bacilli bacterium]|nr:MFS transporter [Bacilli bacterium]
MKKFTSKKQLILYGCSGLGINMLSLFMGSYLCSALQVGGFVDNVEQWTYLNKDIVVYALWTVLAFFAKALDGFIDLPFAYLIDKINTKFGRRKTGLLIGVIPTIITFVLFLIPLNDSATILNTVWFGVILCLFYSFYTLTMLTYYATFREVCATEKDVMFLSNVKSIFDVVYFSLGFALIPIFIGMKLNIRMVALIFLPLSLTMLIPFFMLKEDRSDKSLEVSERITLMDSFKCSLKNKTFIYWMCTISVVTIGLQLFLGGINEVFSSTGLNMTVVMASSFAPVPLTIMAYNKFMKKRGLGFAYRFVLTVFAIGMLVLLFCYFNPFNLTPLGLHIVAVLGGIFISFSIGAFFSITYSVPSNIAELEYKRTGKTVSAMYFAVQGVFEGVAAGIATGVILVALKNFDCIWLLPIIASLTCVIGFMMTFGFNKDISLMGKELKEDK